MAALNLNFRLATAEDAPALERLINTAFRDDKTTQVFLIADHGRIDIISVDMLTAKIAQKQPECAVLAATDASTGAIVAHCSVRRDETRAWFGMLAVDVGYQRRGVGARVLDWAERYARREWASPRMEFDVVNTRADLIAWYTKQGYTPTGESSPFPYAYHGDWKGVLREDLCLINFGKDLR
jgi:GNAT superfamily N-acetyltransferase